MLNLALHHQDTGIYRPRDPQASGYLRCVQDHFEQLEMHWQDRYAQRYGFWRAYVTDVVEPRIHGISIKPNFQINGQSAKNYRFK
jgi:hypothetical protein